MSKKPITARQERRAAKEEVAKSFVAGVEEVQVEEVVPAGPGVTDRLEALSEKAKLGGQDALDAESDMRRIRGESG